ncbi:MAG: septum formation initiator family protein [Deltaproteobacteria bacterium]
MGTPVKPSRETGAGWLTSLAFWLCLFTSAGLYATVTLSPKLLAFLTLNRQYHANQWKLVSLEKQVDHLQKVIDAQRNDPAFVREQARSDFDVAGPDDERIPVESHLRLNIATGKASLPVVSADLPWYSPLLAVVARSRNVSNALLGIAAILVLYAFALLYERAKG